MVAANMSSSKAQIPLENAVVRHGDTIVHCHIDKVDIAVAKIKIGFSKGRDDYKGGDDCIQSLAKKCLDHAESVLQCRFKGLNIAAQAVATHGFKGPSRNRLTKRLRSLNDAVAFIRHLTEIGQAAWFQELQELFLVCSLENDKTKPSEQQIKSPVDPWTISADPWAHATTPEPKRDWRPTTDSLWRNWSPSAVGLGSDGPFSIAGSWTPIDHAVSAPITEDDSEKEVGVSSNDKFADPPKDNKEIEKVEMLTIEQCNVLGDEELGKIPIDRIPATVTIRMMRKAMGLPPEVVSGEGS